MKIALLLTGYMRNWETHFPNINEQILKKYNPDIFISSYSYSELYQGSEIINVDVKSVLDTYKPKSFIFREKETLPEFNFKNNGLEINGREWSYRILKQWYCIYLGLKLFDAQEYDIIIKCRNDFSTKNFSIDENLSLVIPAWKVHPGPCEINESYVDYFAYGKSKYMQKFLALYEKVQEIHDNDWGDISLGETLIRSYVDRYIGQKYVTLDYDIDWKLRDEIWASEYKKIYDNCNGSI